MSGLNCPRTPISPFIAELFSVGKKGVLGQIGPFILLPHTKGQCPAIIC